MNFSQIQNNLETSLNFIDKTLTPEDKEFTRHIPIEQYSADHNGDMWIEDEHLDTDGVFVDLVKNPERFSGYNGSEIWYELYHQNLGQMKFKTAGSHQNFLFRIISGVQVNINMHISKFYLEDLEHAKDVQLEDFGPYYNLYYERIGSHPERIKNLFYAYTFLLHTIDIIKLNLPKYTYDNASNYENERMRNRMKWLGHYVSGLVDLEFNLGNEQQLKDLGDTIKPTFVNITKVLE